MRNIALYTDAPVGELIMKKFKLSIVNSDEASPNGNSSYVSSNPSLPVATLERVLERESPDIEYTIVVDHRKDMTYKYILIELPDSMEDETYYELTNGILVGVENLFGDNVTVGDVDSLPDRTPEQVLSIVVGTKEEETDE